MVTEDELEQAEFLFLAHIASAVHTSEPTVEEMMDTETLLRKADSNLECPTGYDLFIEGATAREYAGQRIVRADRVLVPPSAYSDVEGPEVDDPQAERELRFQAAIEAAVGWVSENVRVNGRTPDFHFHTDVDFGNHFEIHNLDRHTWEFDNGRHITDEPDLNAIAANHDPEDVRWEWNLDN